MKVKGSSVSYDVVLQPRVGLEPQYVLDFTVLLSLGRASLKTVMYTLSATTSYQQEVVSVSSPLLYSSLMLAAVDGGRTVGSPVVDIVSVGASGGIVYNSNRLFISKPNECYNFDGMDVDGRGLQFHFILNNNEPMTVLQCQGSIICEYVDI